MSTRTTLHEYEQTEKLETAKRVISTGLALFWIVNAGLTAAYALAVTLTAFDLAGRGTPYLALVALVALAAVLVTVSLTDGARYIWHNGRIAKGSNSAQQYTAFGMEIISFGLSVWASVVALRFLAAWLGVATVAGYESSHQTMIFVLSAALTTHLVAGFVYHNLSPEQRQASSLAAVHARVQDRITVQVRKTYGEALADLPELVSAYETEVRERIAREFLGEALNVMGHREIPELPQHVTTAERHNVPPDVPERARNGVSVPLGVNGHGS